MTRLQQIAKIQAIQVVAMLAIGKHPDYALKKARLLSDPMAFIVLDGDNVLDAYFEMWNLTLEWEHYKTQIQKDYESIPLTDFWEKYKIKLDD